MDKHRPGRPSKPLCGVRMVLSLFLFSGRKGCIIVEFIEFISQLISNVGFPIACVAVMFYQMEQERKAHKEESNMWVEALNRNTNVMEQILHRLEVK